MKRTLLAALLLASSAGCFEYPRDSHAPPGDADEPGPGGDPGGDGNDEWPGIFTPAVTEIALEVDYQPGAEPYTGGTLYDPWELFDANADALLTAPVYAPHQLSEMEPLTGLTGNVFDQQRIFELVAKHRQQHSTRARRTFYVLFLDGHFDTGDGQGNRNILGVSFGNTEVIAMFKPVIESSSLDLETRRVVEQTTMIHEFGHAVGLVNNGVAMVNAHQDVEHGAHCSNEDCVMYWLNHQDPGSVASFAVRRITGGSTVVFDEQCLDDAKAAAGSP